MSKKKRYEARLNTRGPNEGLWVVIDTKPLIVKEVSPGLATEAEALEVASGLEEEHGR